MTNILNNIDPETGLIKNGRLIKTGGNVFTRIGSICDEIQVRISRVRKNIQAN